ncbi:Aspartyl-tRNA(Asn) amidotransferase subunit A [Candidatus Nasuia deltocephalinicola]|nr:Aspartyl-tRNA(Asn) amidotransferase subunit A [Candidatus Nasuia deltocephalinicola]
MKNKNILEIHFLLKNKKISCLELVKYFLKKIENNSNFNSLLNFNLKKIFSDSCKIDILIKKNILNVLTGVPFFCKDNFVTKDIITTSGSKLLKNFLSPYDSTLIKRLKNLGCLVLGKTNMNEFCVGSDNFNEYYGSVKNSWNNFFSSGGSSGGSAVSVSLNLSPFSIGSDTGGSLRQPSSLNNLFSIKPTYGRISRYGMISYSSSLDQPGIISTNILNCALVLNVLSGFDLKDSNTLFFKKEDYTKYIGKNWIFSLKNKKFFGLSLGVSKDFYFSDLDYDLRSNFEYVLSQFEFLGAKIFYISFNFIKIIDSLYYIVSSSELSSNLSRFDGIIYGYNKFLKLFNSIDKFRSYSFNNFVKDKIFIGNFILSSKIGRKFFLNSKKIRKLLIDDFQIKFNFCDLIITPVIPVLPWYIFNKNENFFSKIFIDFYTTFVNFLGFPSASIPSGLLKKYNIFIPLSFQIVGNYCKESRLIQICYEFQNNNYFNNSLWN